MNLFLHQTASPCQHSPPPPVQRLCTGLVMLFSLLLSLTVLHTGSTWQQMDTSAGFCLDTSASLQPPLPPSPLPPTPAPRPRKAESSAIRWGWGVGGGVCCCSRVRCVCVCEGGFFGNRGSALVMCRNVRSVIQSDLRNFKVTACGLLSRGEGDSKTNTSSILFVSAGFPHLPTTTSTMW